MDNFRNVPGFDGRYKLSSNGIMIDTWKNKKVIPKIRGKEASFKLYKGATNRTRMVRSWLRLVFPEMRKEGFKDIPGYEGKYGVSKDGKVYSYDNDRLLVPSTSKTSPYLYVNLTKNNKTVHRSIHRLVAMAYIDNPHNLPEVDHIDRDIYNNSVENLRWITRKGNLENTIVGYNRNHRFCLLYHNGKIVKPCSSIIEAARLGSKLFGASQTGLERNLKSKGCEIKSVTTSPLGRRVEN